MDSDQLEHIRWFVRTLHPRIGPDRLVQFVLMRGRAIEMLWMWGEDQTDVLAEVMAMNADGWNAFVGVNPRRTMAGGEVSNVAAVTALAVDFDAKKQRGDWNLVLAELKRLKFPEPSITVQSGNGNHAYWLLDAEENEAVEEIAERLCVLTASDWVQNRNRIMRLPGTINWKDPARWCWADKVTSDVHSLPTIDANLTAVGLPPYEPEPALEQLPRDVPPDLVSAVLRVSGPIQEMIFTGKKPEHFPSNSEVDWAVTVALVRAGCTDEQVWSVFSTYPVGRLKVLGSPTSYLSRTLARAKSEVARDLVAKLKGLALPSPPFVEVATDRYLLSMGETLTASYFWRP